MDIISITISFLSGGVVWEVIKRVVDFKTGEVVDNRKQKKQNRYDLSSEILKIINEGSSKNWSKKPNDNEHINYIGRQLTIEDQKLANLYDKLISRWIICAERNSTIMVGAFYRGKGFPPEKLAQFEESEKYVLKLQSELTKLDQEITMTLKKWRK